MEKFGFGLIGTETEYGLQVRVMPQTETAKGLRVGGVPRRVMEINGAVQSAGINIDRGDQPSSWLFNGGRFYIDAGNLEFTTPEDVSPRAVTNYEFGNRMTLSHLLAVQRMAYGIDCLGLANNTDYHRNERTGTYNTRGHHLNLSTIGSDVDYHTGMLPLLSVISLIGGNGQFVGANKLPEVTGDSNYSISQRALAVNIRGGRLSVGEKTPLIIVGKDGRQVVQYATLDTNMLPQAAWLTTGLVGLAHKLVDEGWQPGIPVGSEHELVANFRDNAMRQGNWVYRAGGVEMPAIEVLNHYIGEIDRKFWWSGNREVVELLQAARSIVDMLSTDPMKANQDIDWVAKKKILDEYDPSGDKSRDLRILCMSFNIIDPANSISAQRKLWDYEKVMIDSQSNPPTKSRAAGRGVFVWGIKDVLSSLGTPPTIGWTTVSSRDQAVILSDPYHPYIEEVDDMLRKLQYK